MSSPARCATRLQRDSVPPENVLVGVSHTHSGPDLFAWWEGDLSAAPWPATLAGAVAAAERALDRLEPAELSSARQTSAT